MAIVEAHNCPHIGSSHFVSFGISHNYIVPIHLDTNDMDWSVISSGSFGEFSGGYLIFPEYRLAFHPHHGSSTWFQTNQIWHGTTPITLSSLSSFRIGFAGQVSHKVLRSSKKK
jgi:hypothetical protein